MVIAMNESPRELSLHWKDSWRLEKTAAGEMMISSVERKSAKWIAWKEIAGLKGEGCGAGGAQTWGSNAVCQYKSMKNVPDSCSKNKKSFSRLSACTTDGVKGVWNPLLRTTSTEWGSACPAHAPLTSAPEWKIQKDLPLFNKPSGILPHACAAYHDQPETDLYMHIQSIILKVSHDHKWSLEEPDPHFPCY